MKEVSTAVNIIVVGVLVTTVAFLAGSASRILFAAQKTATIERNCSQLSETLLILSRLERGEDEPVKAMMRVRLAENVIALNNRLATCDRGNAAVIRSLFADVAKHVEKHPLSLDDMSMDQKVRTVLGVEQQQ